MATAANRVFATVELLEMILLRVNMQTLLVSCHRVHKTFKTTIDWSRELQKVLWFLPDADFKTETPARPAWMDSSGIVHRETPATPIDPRNPLIVKFGQKIGVTYFDYQTRSSSAVKDVSLVIKDSAAARRVKRHSWQKMMVFQGFAAKFHVTRADYKRPEGGPLLLLTDPVKLTRARKQWGVRQKKMNTVDASGLSAASKWGEVAKCLENTIDLIIENGW